MQITLLVTLVLHILSGVFWAGSTFALARTGAMTADQLFRPQMGAAVVAVITGGVLWHLLHPSGFGTMEQIIAPAHSLRSLRRAHKAHCAVRLCAGSQEPAGRMRDRRPGWRLASASLLGFWR